MLTEAQWDEMERIASSCMARARRRGVPGLRERALDAIVEAVAEHGWPDDKTILFRAGHNAIQREHNEYHKHLRHAETWFEPHAERDALAELIADRLGVWELVWGLPEDLWSVVWATAQTLGGGQDDAAALLGIARSTYNRKLVSARQWARQNWICPGETAGGFFRAGTREKRGTAARALYERRRREPYKEAA